MHHKFNVALYRASLRLAQFLLQRPGLVLGGLALSVVVSLGLMTRLQFDFSPQAIYRGNDDLLDYAERFRQTFGYDEAVILVVMEAIGDKDVLSAASLRWQRQLAIDLAQLPDVERVESLATLQVPSASLTRVALRPLIEAESIDDDVADRVRGLLSDQPLVHAGMLSEDDRVCAVPVFLHPGGRDVDSMRETVRDVRETVARHPLPEGFRLHFGGLPELRVKIVHDLKEDLTTLIPLAAAVYLVVLWLMFRRVSGSILPLVAVGIGLAWTMAAFAAANEPLNIVSNVLPLLLLIIGVSSSVQIVSSYAEEAARGRRQWAAAREAIARMAPACLLAAITTAVGFASLATARSIQLQRFGWQAAIGIAFLYVSTLSTLGALFRFFTPPRHVRPEAERPNLLTRSVSGAGYAVARHPRLTIALAFGVVLGAVWLGSGVPINSYSMIEAFPPEHPSVQTLRLIEEKLAGVMPLEISLEARDAELLLDPETYHEVLAVEAYARSLPGVLSVQSYVDLLKEVLVHWPGRRRSESDRELVPAGQAGRVRLKRTEGFIREFSAAFHYQTFVSEDGRRARIRMRLREVGTQATLALIEQLEARLAESFPKAGPVEARLTGEAYVGAMALTTLIRDLYVSLLTASLVIFALIAIEFRSLRIGLIAMLPNLTPLAVTLGYMGLRGYEMNVGNVIVFTICLGLADDNTIHFLYRFREELKEDLDVAQAIRKAFFSTGRAIVATSLLLLAGMTVLLFSNFIPTRRFGELTQVTILGNLMGVLLLLPASLALFWKNAPEPGRLQPTPSLPPA
ncbi:MAG: efflux RND transporter permease subunit [Planctomycetales bacterium]